MEVILAESDFEKISRQIILPKVDRICIERNQNVVHEIKSSVFVRSNNITQVPISSHCVPGLYGRRKKVLQRLKLGWMRRKKNTSTLRPFLHAIAEQQQEQQQ